MKKNIRRKMPGKMSAACFAALLSLACGPAAGDAPAAGRWSAARANEWHARQGWIAGCNFIPSDAVNQLEMWQKETFSPGTIDRELGWARALGFNTVRVYLHSLVWEADREGFKSRLDSYLSIASGHGIKSILVFFDDCWNPEAKTGRQPAPRPGVHNSGWVHDPIASRRADPAANFKLLEAYVKDVVGTFRDDARILMWDLYNEPGNTGQGIKSLPLLKNVFRWARAAGPSQPLTAGMWRLDFHELNKFSFENSDVITYHCYLNRQTHQDWIHFLKLYGRPLVCTEWMCRKFGSTFGQVMPMLKEQGVGAVSWGLVAGKTNTIFAWDDPRPDGREPAQWFHDILRRDGSPYRPAEIEAIKKLTLPLRKQP